MRNRENKPFLTPLNTFFATFSSASGFANGTNAPMGLIPFTFFDSVSPFVLSGSSSSSSSSSSLVVGAFWISFNALSASTVLSFLSFLSFFSGLVTPSGFEEDLASFLAALRARRSSFESVGASFAIFGGVWA